MPSSACYLAPLYLLPFPTRRSSDLRAGDPVRREPMLSLSSVMLAMTCEWSLASAMIFLSRATGSVVDGAGAVSSAGTPGTARMARKRSEEHTSELQSLRHLVCRLLLATSPPSTFSLSLHDALPISGPATRSGASRCCR